MNALYTKVTYIVCTLPTQFYFIFFKFQNVGKEPLTSIFFIFEGYSNVLVTAV